jgi:hypothetical protein
VQQIVAQHRAGVFFLRQSAPLLTSELFDSPAIPAIPHLIIAGLVGSDDEHRLTSLRSLNNPHQDSLALR